MLAASPENVPVHQRWASVPDFRLSGSNVTVMYIYHLPKERIRHLIPSHSHPPQSSFLLLAFLKPKHPSLQLSFPTAHPALIELCPGGTIVLKHHPHHLHLHLVRLIPRNGLATFQSLLLASANGTSARIIWPTDGVNDTAVHQDRSFSRTHQICRHPVAIERPMVHQLLTIKVR